MRYTYILDGDGVPVPCPDAMDWAEWFSDATDERGRRVDYTEVGEQEVSTVFLGLDHSFGGGEPVLWETMVFGEGLLCDEMDRCGGTRKDAQAMHDRMVDRVRSAQQLYDAQG